MSEYHLFILWEKARVLEQRILDDIRLHFSIISTFEIEWSKEHVSDNFSRFYGTNLPPNSGKEQHCGSGPFLLIVVRDDNPHYDYRDTSRGPESVNTNLFDAKSKYRKWSGGGHKIHATNTPKETNHDLTLLLGINVNDFLTHNTADGSFEYLKKDIAGANGWKSLSELFYVLSNTVDYVVLRGKNELLQNKFTNEHRDIDILTSDYINAKYVINGKSYCNKYRPHEKLTIGAYDYYLDLWQIQRKYFDPYWCKNIMETRVRIGNYWFLDSTNEFYVLLYHCLIFKNEIADDYKKLIEEWLSASGKNNVNLYELLVAFLNKHKYEIYFAPLDQSIKVHTDNKSIQEYACRYGRLISRNETDCNGIHYLTKVYKRDTSFFKVATKDIIDREYCFLKRLENEPYFPKVVGYGALDTDLKYIEITKCQGEDPTTFFENPAHQHLHYIKSFVQEGLKVIQVLIKHNIIHRDIIPRNILVTEKNGKCSINIIDFGWSTDIGDKNAVTPELFGYRDNMGGYSDVYSLGLTLNKIGNNYETRYVFRVREILKQITSVDYADTKFLSRKIEQIQKQLSPTLENRLSEWKFHLRKRHYKEFAFSLLPFQFAYKCRNLCRSICARR